MDLWAWDWLFQEILGTKFFPALVCSSLVEPFPVGSYLSFISSVCLDKDCRVSAALISNQFGKNYWVKAVKTTRATALGFTAKTWIRFCSYENLLCSTFFLSLIHLLFLSSNVSNTVVSSCLNPWPVQEHAQFVHLTLPLLVVSLKDMSFFSWAACSSSSQLNCLHSHPSPAHFSQVSLRYACGKCFLAARLFQASHPATCCPETP